MPRFALYQQFPPRALPSEGEQEQEYAANLIHVGDIEAPDGNAALRLARRQSRFKERSRSTLLAFPIVEATDGYTQPDTDPGIPTPD